MRILLLNQCFYPDHVATAQYLTELGLGLVAQGHEVTVVASSRGYDDPSRRFPVQEEWCGIHVHRIWTPGLGKTSWLRRFVDFAVFWLNAARILLMLPRQDVTICLTSPPLISTLGTATAAVKGGKVIPWIMDLNPDEAVAAGWLKRGGLMDRVLSTFQRWSFGRAAKIVVLDRFMADLVRAKGVDPSRIQVLPPWSHDGEVRYDVAGRERFREAHGLTGKFVVMYSGNHSPCHPLDVVLAASNAMRDDLDIRFVFVGGGSEFAKVKDFVHAYGLQNVITLPYQPMQELSSSLSAADIHLVVMGDAFVGMIHPCKIYNILNLGIPFLNLGPEQSHLAEMVDQVGDEMLAARLPNADPEQLVGFLQARARMTCRAPEARLRELGSSFAKQQLMPRLIEVIEAA
jgi:colanic acid biosynthesis glycosyl transferase WcaI